MRIALAIVLLVASTAAYAWSDHWAARSGVVGAETLQAGQRTTLIVGDSQTEMFWPSLVYGCETINAGYGGARIRQLYDMRAWLANLTRPRNVHIMIGLNNLRLETDTEEWLAMEAELTAIVEAFQGWGSRVVLWRIPPVGASAASLYPNTKRNALNSIIALVASATGANLEHAFATALTGPDGHAAPGALNGDGVHFSASSQEFRAERMEAWRQYFKAQTGIDCH